MGRWPFPLALYSGPDEDETSADLHNQLPMEFALYVRCEIRCESFGMFHFLEFEDHAVVGFEYNN
jgi:hypothetical protein